MKPLLCCLLVSATLLPFVSIAQDEVESEKYTSDIAAFAERDQETPPGDGALLFVGSSSIRLWDLAAAWPDTETINNGFGGSTLADSIYWFDQLFPPYTPGSIVLYAGDNDIKKGLTARETFDDFTTLAAKIRTAHPDVPILYIAIKPSRARWELWPTMKEANDFIREYCESTAGFAFVDIAAPMLEGAEGAPDERWFIADGLHLSDYGNAEWTRLVKEVLAGRE